MGPKTGGGFEFKVSIVYIIYIYIERQLTSITKLLIFLKLSGEID
jgi:hypothetical protein